ncbi:MAG: hypothetical protein IPI81_13555 [Flavobacteriales bacterium]|nr:hypothetical protein [Flavobacteriales bacterium]
MFTQGALPGEAMSRMLGLGWTLVLALSASAQLDVPARVVMVGTAPEDRQVIGLSAPLSNGSAVSVDAARNSAVSFTPVTGGAVLAGILTPAPTAYVVGMVVSVVPSTANADSAQLDLNGLGPRPIHKAGDLPLDSADLWPGVPARMVYDGTAFRMLSTTYLPCPAGYHAGGREFCIEDSVRADTTFLVAVHECRTLDSRLCSYAEWVHACRSEPSFLGTVLDAEWVDSAANDQDGAKRVGYGGDGSTLDPEFGCNRGSWAHIATGKARYRCCRNR